MVRTFLRDAALPMTWLLLHTPVTANQITLISLLIGLAGVCFMALPGPGLFLLGAVFLQLWYYLDHVDGQIARYRGTACLSGRFFDFITHHLIHGVLFFGLGFYVYGETQSVFFLVLGFIVSVSMMMFNLIHDTKYKTFFEKLEKMDTVYVRRDAAAPTAERAAPKSGAHLAFSVMHKLCEIHVAMNILTLAAVLDVWFKTAFDFRFLLFAVYALIVPVLAAVKTSYFITAKKVDQEFEERFGPA